MMKFLLTSKPFQSKNRYQLGFALLICLSFIFLGLSSNNGAGWIGAAFFSAASIAVFYRFHWVKYFFYTWCFIWLLNFFISAPYLFTCAYTRDGIGTIFFVITLLELISFYAVGRLINRIEPKKLNENWVDVIAIAGFIAIPSTIYAPSIAFYLNDLYHLVPSLDALFNSVEGVDETSLYFDWGLFLWPAWLLDITVNACFVFLLSLPFYKLWRLKHAMLAAVFMPVIDLAPVFICFISASLAQAVHIEYFFGELFLIFSLQHKAVFALGILIGGLCTVILKKYLQRDKA